MATGTFNIAAGSTVTDTFALLLNSSVPLALTPAHQATVQAGSAAVRVGDPADVQSGNGLLLQAGESRTFSVPAGSRIGMLGNGGSAVTGCAAVLQVG